MPTQFPGRIPVPAQNPYPNEPVYGNSYADIGAVVGGAGQELINYEEGERKQKSREAKIQDMIERRKQAMAVQQAREDYQNKTMEFNKAKEAQDIEESKRSYDRGVQEFDRTQTRLEDKEKAAEAEKTRIRDSVASFNEKLYEAEKEGNKLSRTQTRRLAYASGLGEDWEKYAPDRPYKPSSAAGTRTNKIAQYKNLLPRLQRQLQGLVGDLNATLGTKFTRNQLVQSMRGLDTRIETVSDEKGKRSALRRNQDHIRKKIEEIDKVKSYLSTEEGSGSALDEADEYQAALDELNSLDEELNQTPDPDAEEPLH